MLNGRLGRPYYCSMVGFTELQCGSDDSPTWVSVLHFSLLCQALLVRHENQVNFAELTLLQKFRKKTSIFIVGLSPRHFLLEIYIPNFLILPSLLISALYLFMEFLKPAYLSKHIYHLWPHYFLESKHTDTNTCLQLNMNFFLFFFCTICFWDVFSVFRDMSPALKASCSSNT